jgi:hypothetical protein
MFVSSFPCALQLAISMSNTGGAWDNAKKFVEKGGLVLNVNGVDVVQRKGRCVWICSCLRYFFTIKLLHAVLPRAVVEVAVILVHPAGVLAPALFVPPWTAMPTRRPSLATPSVIR